MATLDDLWQDLFDKPITDLERRVMKGVFDYVDERSPILILSAVVVYYVTLVLIRDPRSALAISRELGETLEQLEKRLNENEQCAYLLRCAQEELWIEVEHTRNVLSIARSDAKERRGLPLSVYVNIGLVCFASVGSSLMLSVWLISR